ncbi:MAG: tetratricopeptide repeat protein [Bacteroidales bacterium]|jgi:tetratricopeptide (TPR) repeat protein|nr:tetratricopeptide repeat protein [Bacteroidales bacterium]MDD4213184.1 tetratricopeptide repeat protein [Bacteroidales bacterium]
MKHFNIKVIAALVLAVVMFTGCGLNKMIKKYPTVNYTVTPEVLESHGGKISVGVNGTIPPKYFNKKASVTITPVIKSMDGVTLATLKSITLKGEKNKGQGQVIKYKEGGSFSYTDVVNFTDNMKMSELYIGPLATKGKKVDVPLGTNKLADGVINTSSRIEHEEDLEVAAHGYELETIITKKGNLYYEYNKSNLNMSLSLNKDLANAAIRDALFAFLVQNWKIKSIDINAWASPEGELTLNKKLSDERGKTAKTWFEEQIKKIVLKDKQLINNSVAPEIPEKGKKALKIEVPQLPVTVNSKGEDFDGFMKALNTSNIPQKQTISNVIQSQATKAEREKSIKDMTVIYAEVENMLSVLRRAEFTISCYEPKKSKEEIIMLSTTTPEKLDNKELLYSATLTDNVETQYTIYKSATTIYPNDWKAFNNAGMCALKLDKLDEAQTYLEKANQLNPNDGQILYNLGVLSSWKNENEAAQDYFNKAQQKGIDVSYNNAVLKSKQGDYAAALSSYGTKKCKYNVALAQMLSGNNTAALQTLECTKPQTGAVHYLAAINAARTKNTSVMYEHLTKAVQKNSKYRKEAMEDREFLKYHKEPAFLDAIK